MPKCSFCGVQYHIPRGLTLVKTDGSILYLCSGKCRKNIDLGRKKKRVKWITKMKVSEEIIKEEQEKSKK